MESIQKNDIANLEDIKRMVDNFYGRVREDELLGEIFNEVIKENWPVHLDKMYRFWQTVLLGDYTYSGTPFAPHVKLPVEKMHFDRWKALFYETVDESFEGKKATEAKWRAEKMAEMFQYKLAHYREVGNKPIG